MPDGRIVGVGKDRKLYLRQDVLSDWSGPLDNSGVGSDISVSNDGFLYGVGMDKM